MFTLCCGHECSEITLTPSDSSGVTDLLLARPSSSRRAVKLIQPGCHQSSIYLSLESEKRGAHKILTSPPHTHTHTHDGAMDSGPNWTECPLFLSAIKPQFPHVSGTKSIFGGEAMWEFIYPGPRLGHEGGALFTKQLPPPSDMFSF